MDLIVYLLSDLQETSAEANIRSWKWALSLYFCSFITPIVQALKVQQSLPGQQVKGEGLWLNSLDYLLVCYTQCSILTVLYVVCYQSVTRNSNNISGYVYNIEYITQPTPISHSPGKFKFWIWRLIFFLKLIFLVVLSKLF